jgi:hypothetical protein
MDPKALLVSSLDRNRRIGCEYECVIPQIGTADPADARRVIAEILTANGIPAIARAYSHAPLPHGIDIAVENDSSVRGEAVYHGVRWVAVEVKTRILGGADDWERIVPKTLEVLNYLGCRVNASTGHHIHVEVAESRERPEVIRSVVNVFSRFESVLLGCVAPSRRGNLYCDSIDGIAARLARLKTREEFMQVISGTTRHATMNLQNLSSDGPRVEIRMHHGTLDSDKARHWMRLCLTLVSHGCRRTCKRAPSPLPDNRKGMEKLLVTLGFKPNSKVYRKVEPELRATGRFLLRRWRHFHRHTGSGPSNV